MGVCVLSCPPVVEPVTHAERRAAAKEGKGDAHVGTVNQIRVNHMSTTDLPSRIARRS